MKCRLSRLKPFLMSKKVFGSQCGSLEGSSAAGTSYEISPSFKVPTEGSGVVSSFKTLSRRCCGAILMKPRRLIRRVKARADTRFSIQTGAP